MLRLILAASLLLASSTAFALPITVKFTGEPPEYRPDACSSNSPYCLVNEITSVAGFFSFDTPLDFVDSNYGRGLWAGGQVTDFEIDLFTTFGTQSFTFGPSLCEGREAASPPGCNGISVRDDLKIGAIADNMIGTFPTPTDSLFGEMTGNIYIDLVTGDGSWKLDGYRITPTGGIRPGGFGGEVTSVQVDVPEPAEILLLATGILGLVFARRKLKQDSSPVTS